MIASSRTSAGKETFSSGKNGLKVLTLVFICHGLCKSQERKFTFKGLFVFNKIIVSTVFFCYFVKIHDVNQTILYDGIIFNVHTLMRMMAQLSSMIKQKECTKHVLKKMVCFSAWKQSSAQEINFPLSEAVCLTAIDVCSECQ